MDESARQVALSVLLKWDCKSSARDLLDTALSSSKLSNADKAFVSELVYGSIRWRKKIDWVISLFSKREVEKIDQIGLEVLRLGVYQLLLVENMPPHAAVNETVNLARLTTHEGVVKFVNALLREVDRQKEKISYPSSTSQPIAYIATSCSFPQWIVERWIKRYGYDETLALCEASNSLPTFTIRANTLKIDPLDLAQKLSLKGWKLSHSKLAPEGLNLEETPPITELEEFKKGEIFVQDEASMLISHLVDPKPGELVVDVCAAPGGKSTHLAQLMQNRGEIVAVDISKKRSELTLKNCRRLGVNIVKTTLADARNPVKPLMAKADRVLVDAPCSGFGSLRRKPDIRWSKTRSNIKSLSKLQVDILNSSCRYLKPKGVLVYSVCSFEPEENEEVVSEFLESHPNFYAQNAFDFLPEGAKSALSEDEYMRSYPHLHHIDGFFAARLKLRDCHAANL